MDVKPITPDDVRKSRQKMLQDTVDTHCIAINRMLEKGECVYGVSRYSNQLVQAIKTKYISAGWNIIEERSEDGKLMNLLFGEA